MMSRTTILGYVSLTLFTAILPPVKCNTETIQYKHIGCFKDEKNSRALPKWLKYVTIDGTQVQVCAARANTQSYTIFSVQYDWECWGQSADDKSYSKYGPSNDCRNGVGGNLANDVYQITDEVLWPRGTFSILKPTSGCPRGFIDNGWLLQDTVDNIINQRSSILNIDGYVTKGYVVRSFCTKTIRTSPDWPKGQYCLYEEGDRHILESGRIYMYNAGNRNVNHKKMMHYNRGVKISYRYKTLSIGFVCQTTGDKSVPIDLPINQPFYLLPYGSAECQQVKWMVASKEWIQYGTRNYQGRPGTSGKFPYVKIGTPAKRGITMFYCFYKSCNHTLNDTRGVFQSPRYPDNYTDGQLCSWRILVPVNHTVIVHFTQFSLVEDEGRKDYDVLELYQVANNSMTWNKTWKGRQEPFRVTSKSDVLLVFRSNEANSSFGFSAVYEIFIPEKAESTTVRPIKTTVPTTAAWTTTESTTTNLEPTNKNKQKASQDDNEKTGTVILIVIPLVCVILIVVIGIDIYCRCRIKSGAKNKNVDSRYEPGETGENNLTYGSPAEIPMTNFNGSTAVSTENNIDSGYDRLKHASPRRDIPEQYNKLNRTSNPSNNQDNDPSSFYHVLEDPDGQYEEPIRTSYPSTTNKETLSNNDPNSFYHVLEEPMNTSGDDDGMYQTVDKDTSPNGLYAANIVYDSVA